MKHPFDKEELKLQYIDKYGEEPQHYFDCGGRFEILGNHTDHNHGLCLASACNLQIIAGVRKVEGKNDFLISSTLFIITSTSFHQRMLVQLFHLKRNSHD